MALKRVNHTHPCPVCRKTSWCGYNDKIIVCARTTDGADKLTRNGEGIFNRNEAKKDSSHSLSFLPHTQHLTPNTCPHPSSSPNTRHLTPATCNIEATHALYTALLTLSPLLTNSPHITHPTQGLVARGFNSFETFGYYPGKHSGRFRLLKKALQQAPVNGEIPGIWYSSRGWEFGWPGDSQDALMIPIRRRDGKIQAIQLRYVTEIKENRYRWLSTPNLPQGCGSGTPIHYLWPEAHTGKVLLVEGALKAEALRLYYPQHAMIATAGINYGHAEIIQECAEREFVICFDQDAIDSSAWIEVQYNLFKLLELRREQDGSLVNTWLAKWHSDHKGIDDAARNNAPIKLIPGQRAYDWLSKIDFQARRQRKLHRK